MNPKKLKTVRKKMVKKNKIKIKIRVEKEVELLPCPFCGGEPVVSSTSNLNVELCIECMGCNASMYTSSDGCYDFTTTTVEMWNRRVK